MVWLGAHTTLAGTDAYAHWAGLLPLAILVFGVRRRGGVNCVRDLRQFAGLEKNVVLVNNDKALYTLSFLI